MGGSGDLIVAGTFQVHRHVVDVAAVRQVHPPARRRIPFVGLIGGQQRRDLFDQVGGFGDHLVGRVGAAGVVLQRAHRLDEPAVIGPASIGGVGRVEPAAWVGAGRVDFWGHPVTVLPDVDGPEGAMVVDVKPDDLARLSLTYPEVGATAGELPTDYRHTRASAVIGTGRDRFERAAA